MPRLTRMRLVCVGHPNARFEDVILNFQDHQGRPIDSTLWLRNGGGKSSLLNLFFAVVRPDKREFLGGKAEAKRRKLEDYVQTGDRSVVICEWEADPERDSLGLSGVSQKILTGVFYEWRSGATDLRHLFFGCRVAPDQPQSTLDGLPLYRMEHGKKAARKTMAVFKQHWSDLRDAQPHLSVTSTEHQGEWAEWLSGARIDPDLFSYQVRMNHREGGADELFRFDEPEQFVDFLLDLVLDPSLAEAVRRNIQGQRDDLKERTAKLLPMRELLTGLLARLQPIEEIGDRRAELHEKSSIAALRLASLDGVLNARILEATEAAAVHAAASDRLAREEKAAKEDARILRKRIAWLDRHLIQDHIKAAEAEFHESRARMDDASRSFKLMQAAIPLRDALRFEGTAREYRADLERRNKEHAPLARELEAAAAACASALCWQLDSVRKSEEAARTKEKESRALALSLRTEAGESKALASRYEAEAKSFEGRLKESKKALEVLRKQAVLGEGESAEEAAARMGREAGELSRSISATAARLASQRQERSQLAAQKETLAAEAARSGQRLVEANTRLGSATKEKTALEATELLRRRLQVETLDLEISAEGVVEALKHQHRDESERLIGLRIDQSSGERSVAALEQSGLLPPSADAEKVLRAVKQHIHAAWSGWTYLSENTPEDPEQRRAAIRRRPQAVMGVVIADKDFERACRIAKEQSLSLDSPVALIKQSDFNAGAEVLGFVVGPLSDAYHSKGAGKEELLRRRRDSDAAGENILALIDSRSALDGLLRSLESFLERHPKGWFRRQEDEVSGLSMASARADQALLSATEAGKALDAEIDRSAASLVSLQKEHQEIETKQLIIGQFSSQYGTKIAGWEASLIEARQRTARAAEKAEAREKEAFVADAAAEDSKMLWVKLGLDASALDVRLRRVLPRINGPAPKARKGSIASLETAFQHLESVYDEKVDEAGLSKGAKENDDNAQRSRRKLGEVLGDLSENDVKKTLDAMDDPEEAESRFSQASDERDSIRGIHGNAAKRLDELKKALKKAEEPCVELTVTDRDRPREEAVLQSIVAGEQAVVQYRSELAGLDAAAERAGAASTESLSNAERSEHKAALLKKDADNLAGIKGRFEAILKSAPPSGPAAVDDAVIDVQSGLKEVEAILKALQAESSRLDAERRQGVAKIRAWAGESRFQALNSAMIQRFASMDVELESEAKVIRPELVLHLEITEQKLAEKDRNRELLVQEIWGATEEGLSLLDRAARQSRLPDSLPGLGGSQFLHITLSTPADPAERRARLGSLVDEWINGGDIPSAMGLIQQAVHRLARPIRVKVLNPDPDLKSQSVDITEMTRFSGGERLTCAILLYCTLAQLRARHRGMSRSPSSVLLLDNPIGRASRPKFLELQRAVAKEMGVQLIYTTGVDDYGALHALPNIIRLKNSRVNVGTGQRHVEIESAAGVLEAAQISRKEAAA